MKLFGQVSLIKKQYIAFFGVVGVAILTALISVPCPVCNGTGKATTAVGMENVFIAQFESNQSYVSQDFCMGWVLYKYTVNLTLSNGGDETATGWIKLVLKRFLTGQPLDTNYVNIEVPGSSTVQDSFAVWFQTPFEVSPDSIVDAVIELGGVKCLACNGTSSVSVNTWLLANSVKSTLLKITRLEHEFKPPPFTEYEPPEGY